jgi:two-component system nitrate/nitrite sensor histidine kinase NarX
MAKPFSKSLTLRLGLAMTAITTLAFLGMLSSVFIADVSEGQAAAINQSGTLRMQSYRIASALAAHRLLLGEAQRETVQQLQDEFQTRFADNRLTGVLAKTKDPAIHAAYQKVKSQWQNEIQPLLNRYLSSKAETPEQLASLAQMRNAYLQQVDEFVDGIDRLVRALETEAEANIQWLRLIQVISLFLTLAVVITTMYFVYTNVLPPLQELLGSAQAARHGDFSHRTLHDGNDELGELGNAFNRMAEDLSKIYADLESRVQEKTCDLERSNRSLELLYKATSRLLESPASNDVYENLLHDIEELIDIRHGAICLGKDGYNKAIKLASTFSPTNSGSIFRLCEKKDCSDCFSGGESHPIHFEMPLKISSQYFSTPIKDTEQQYGVLVIELPENHSLEEWQERLLEAIASHIAVALKMAHRTSQSRMIALLEERGVMARELHDSLAQSLSYLKIQVTRLNAALSSTVQDSKVKSITGELRDGLNNAYRELRELLTTFRLKLDEEGLSRTLEKTVAEFTERSNVDIQLDDLLGNCQLSPNAEIHITQLVREALSNVVRHSHATQAIVRAEFDPRGEVIIVIDDNGIGMREEKLQKHHYGLTIMRERAQELGGLLTVTASELGGTRVKLRFDSAGKEKYSEPVAQPGNMGQ